MGRATFAVALLLVVLTGGACHANAWTWDFQLVCPNGIGNPGDTLTYYGVFTNSATDMDHPVALDYAIFGVPGFPGSDFTWEFDSSYLPPGESTHPLLSVVLPEGCGTWDGDVTFYVDADYYSELPEPQSPPLPLVLSRPFTVTITSQPVPEPVTAVLLGAGLIGLAGLRRRRLAT